jgi:glycerol-3-phosphate dehydrogenase (NAD(P)+)
MTSAKFSPIAVLGAGSWGTALALHLAKLQQEVRLWTMNTEHVAEMQRDKVNSRYLPSDPFPSSLQPISGLADTIVNCDDILIAIPSAGLRNIFTLLKPLLKKPTHFIFATKGLDFETSKLSHDLAEEILGPGHTYAILSGPSFAQEVAKGLPTAVVIASSDAALAQHALQRFNSPLFRVYSSSDIIGVEICGVVKNVLAIACGISDGMGFGANARSGLITRGLHEMTRLGLAIGAKTETFTGLAGVGDLVLTCTDNQSRNRRFGLSLGQGKSPEEATRAIGQVIEGQRNAEIVVQLAKAHHVEMPISEMVLKILKKELTSLQAMQQLLSRVTKNEKQ